jgi:hypothetical protein
VPSARPGKNRLLSSVLHGMSCSAGTGCLAVGYRQLQSGAFATLTEHWTGSSWDVVPSPSPRGSPYSNLSAISCVSACIAVGSSYNDARRFVPLGEVWTGSGWHIVRGPQVAGRPDGISYLLGVACSAGLKCTAVGTSGDPANLHPLTQAWSAK